MSDEGKPRPIAVSARVAKELRKHPDLIPPWSTRIPAAIEHAEQLTQDGDYSVPAELTSYIAEPEERLVAITVGEVALAKALWKTYRTLNTESGEEHWPAPLIAFVEKVEKLA